MSIDKHIIEFIAKFVLKSADLIIAIAYGKTVLECLDLAPEKQAEMKQKLNHCEKLLKRYTEILNKNISDWDYMTKAFRLYNSLEYDTFFVRNFLYKLDACLIEFGDGPRFKSEKIMYHDQLEI